jgi:2-desacetyl-2-hydroxyethyl bacteriochlorophyllide A dehydrogenase
VPKGRGVWFVGPRQVEIREVDLPPLSEGQVLVRTSWSGISSGSEMLAYRGEIDPGLPADETISALEGTFSYPFRYGYSCVGLVEESRAGLSVGSRVFAFHPHQDRFVVGSGEVVPLGVADLRAATMFPLVETALQVTLDAGPVLDDPVVVFGLGAVGVLTALLLGRAGARVIAVEPLAWRRDAARRAGVEAVDPGEVEGVFEDRGLEDGVPLVVEATGRPSVLADSLPLLAHEGTALVVSWYGTKEVKLPLGADFHRRRLTIQSTQVSTIPARLAGRWSARRRRQTAGELLDTLPLDILATHAVPFDDAPDAFDAVDRGEEGLIHSALWYG